MGAQTETACLASHLSLATFVIIRVLSAWLSEIPLHLNFTLSLAHLGCRNSHSHFADEVV